MLHHARDEDGLAVAQGVDVDLGGARQILVDQHRVLDRDVAGLGDVAVKLVVIVDDLHAAAAQDIGGADDDREADLVGLLDGLGPAAGQVIDRLGDVQSMQQLLEALAILGQVDGVG